MNADQRRYVLSVVRPGSDAGTTSTKIAGLVALELDRLNGNLDRFLAAFLPEQEPAVPEALKVPDVARPDARGFREEDAADNGHQVRTGPPPGLPR